MILPDLMSYRMLFGLVVFRGYFPAAISNQLWLLMNRHFELFLFRILKGLWVSWVPPPYAPVARGREDPSHLVSPSEAVAAQAERLWGCAGSMAGSCFTNILFMVTTGFPLQAAPGVFGASGAAEVLGELKPPSLLTLMSRPLLSCFFLLSGMRLQEPLQKPQTMMSREDTGEISLTPYN